MVREASDAGDALLAHAVSDDRRDPLDSCLARAVARELQGRLIASVSRCHHHSVSLASYNAVIQRARPRADRACTNDDHCRD